MGKKKLIYTLVFGANNNNNQKKASAVIRETEIKFHEKEFIKLKEESTMTDIKRIGFLTEKP